MTTLDQCQGSRGRAMMVRVVMLAAAILAEAVRREAEEDWGK
jgi:hypothetical protein